MREWVGVGVDEICEPSHVFESVDARRDKKKKKEA